MRVSVFQNLEFESSEREALLDAGHWCSDCELFSVLKIIARLRMKLEAPGLRLLGAELTNMSLTLSQVPLLGWAGTPSSLVNS